MKAPELKANAGIYVLIWADEQIEIRVDRLSEHSQSVTGEIVVSTTLPGMPRHLHQARFNLTSTQTRHTLAKYLLERMNLIDWDAVIEQTCVKVLEHYRRGEPVVNMDSWMPEKERMRYRIKPLLLEGQPNLFYGPGGVGKSLFATYLSVLVREGYPEVKVGLDVEPGPTLYLDYEASQEETYERVKAIQAGLAIEKGAGLLYRFCHQPLINDIEQIQRLVLEEKIQFVVVDSAAPACGGQPESAEFTLQLFTALRSLRITSLILAHIAKNASVKTVFGSVYWTNMARSVFELKKAQEVGEGILHFGMFHRKVNTGRLQPPMAFKITLVNNEDDKLISVKIDKEKAIRVPEFEKEHSLPARVFELLRGGPRTIKEILKELELPAEKDVEVGNLLRRLSTIYERLDNDQKEHTWSLRSST